MERVFMLRPYAGWLLLCLLVAATGAAVVWQKGFAAVTLLFALLFGGAVLLPSATGQQSPVMRVFVLAACLLLLGLGAFNYVMNPLGIYPPRFFEPLIFATRNQKMNMFSALAPPPQTLILGSSRSFTVDPTQIEALWGYRTFNASLTAGGARDYLAFTRFALQSGADLKLLIVNVAVESFQKLDLRAVEPDASLWDYLDSDPLRAWSTRFDQLTRLFSKQQTDASLRLLNVERAGRPPSQYHFDERGQGYFYAPNPVDVAVEAFIEAGWDRVFLQENFDLPNALGTFEQFLQLCRDNHIQVIGYLPPYHPRLLQLVETQNEYSLLHAQVIRSLEDFESTYDFSFIDFVYSPLFVNPDETFFDAVHPKPAASALMMQTLRDAFPPTENQP